MNAFAGQFSLLWCSYFFLDDSFTAGTSENCRAAHSPLWKVHTTCYRLKTKWAFIYLKKKNVLQCIE